MYTTDEEFLAFFWCSCEARHEGDKGMWWFELFLGHRKQPLDGTVCAGARDCMCERAFVK